jgi:hypothetical protein
MKQVFTLLMFCLVSFVGWGQVTIWSEDFETDGNGTRYTASLPFNDGSSDHWNRTDGSNISNVSGSYTGFSNSFFWAAEDTDDNGGNGNDEQIIIFSSTNTSGYENLIFRGLFGAGNENSPGNSGYDNADYIQVDYSTDGGSNYTPGICFGYEDHGDAFNEPIGLDSDCNGVSDNNGSNRLLNSLSEYTFNISGTPSSITIRIRVYMDSASEEIAFDNFRLEGTLVLPISLATFSAKKQNSSTLIQWTTSTEINNDYMAVERSANGRDFAEIGRVQGAGTTQQAQEYEFVDTRPMPGLNYYRLKQVDYDGQYEYHKTVVVDFSGKQQLGLNVYPTLANSHINLILTGDQEIDEGTQLQIVGADGRVWQSIHWLEKAGQMELPVASLPAGHYWVKLINKEQVQQAYFQKH